MTETKTKVRSRVHYRRIELLIPKPLASALDNFRASKRPIPCEADAIRWLMAEALIDEGFEPEVAR